MAAKRHMNRFRTWAGPVLLITLLASTSAWAGLTGLVRDVNDGSLRVVQIDSATGEVTAGSASLADCCRVGAGLTAVDLGGNQLFAFGHQSAGDDEGNPLLMQFSLDGQQATTVTPDRLPQAVMAYDNQSSRLYSVSLSPAPDFAIQWFSLDPATGQSTLIGNPATDCCEILAGLGAIANLPGGGRGLYFVGRPSGSPDWHLLAADLNNGDVVDLATLPGGTPGFLVVHPTSGVADFMIQTTLADSIELYRVDPATGIVTNQASHDVSNCCLVSPGDVASLSSDEPFWWIGGSGAQLNPPGAGFFALLANADTNQAPARTLLGNYRLHALVVSGTVVSPDLIFRDRFQL
jgi:hypothetical protein